MDDSTDPNSSNHEQLIHELQELERLLREKFECRETDAHSHGWALVRLVEDLDQEQLKELTTLSGIDPSWMILPLNHNSFPVLHNLKKTIEQLTLDKDTDALTGMNNRRFFHRILERELERSYQFKMPLTLAIMDIDNFKDINDTWGHLCGDEVLRSLAGILHEEIRASDYAARIGGEEFALILPGTSRYKAEPLLFRILKRVRSDRVKCLNNKEGFHYTLSIGAATFRGRKETTPERLIADVDNQLYAIKNQGKNSVAAHIFQEVLEEDSLVQSEEKNFLLKG